MRYAPDMTFLEPGQGHIDPKVVYVTLSDPKMHSQTKFGIPTSNNIGDVL